MNKFLPDTKEYFSFIEELKIKIKSSQLRTAFSVNKELIFLYFEIGKGLLEKQQLHKWGDKFLEGVAFELSKEFPNIKGFSLRNLKYMKQFASKFASVIIGQQAAAQLFIPWGHHILLLDKGLELDEYMWYADQSIAHGWSRNMLSIKIDSKIYKKGNIPKISNFKDVLPPSHSDLAQNILKDPYILTFVDESHLEKEFEKSLINHIQKFLLELGKGFAFVGSQYPIDVDNQTFFLDLLFYHIKLKSYIVIELKNTKFKPEYAGKLNFYLNALDAQLRGADDNASLGIILCKEKNKLVAEYALKGITTPVGIASYEIKEQLPDKFKDSLPTPEELEHEFVRATHTKKKK